MRKSFSFIPLIFLCSLFAYAEDYIEAALSDALNTFASERAFPTVVSIGNFTYADKNVGSSFSGYLQEKLGAAIIRNPGFELFARASLDEVLELVDIETGTLSGKAELTLSKLTIPASVSILPDNYNDAMYVLDELSEVQNAGNEEFVVKAWTTRGDGGVYREVERLVINFYANRDCFIKLYHIDVHKKMKLIFPNQYSPNNRIIGRKIYKIPDSSYPFTFNLTAPYGAEFIKVIASTVRFSDIEESFQEIGSASARIVARGLSVNARPEQITEALISYTIIE